MNCMTSIGMACGNRISSSAILIAQTCLTISGPNLRTCGAIPVATLQRSAPRLTTWFLRKVAAVVIGESFGAQQSIASIASPPLQARDRLRCLATGVGLGKIFRSSMSFSSVEFGDVKTSRWPHEDFLERELSQALSTRSTRRSSVLLQWSPSFRKSTTKALPLQYCDSR